MINLDSVSKISRKHDQKSPKSPTADIKIHFTTRIVSLIQILSEIMATMNKLIGWDTHLVWKGLLAGTYMHTSSI